MSRIIDLTKPLSEDDRQYLLQRNETAKIIANDAEFADGDYADPADLNPADQNPAALELSGRTPVVVDTPPPGDTSGADPVTDDDDSEDDDSEDDNAPDYEHITKEEIKARLDSDFDEPVPYKANDDRDTLVSLLKQARGDE